MLTSERTVRITGNNFVSGDHRTSYLLPDGGNGKPARNLDRAGRPRRRPRPRPRPRPSHKIAYLQILKSTFGLLKRRPISVLDLHFRGGLSPVSLSHSRGAPHSCRRETAPACPMRPSRFHHGPKAYCRGAAD